MDFRKAILNGFRLKIFFLKHLPLGFFTGLKVAEINEKGAVVSLPFNWITKNPFRSIYFGAQAMAAELSTGIIAAEAARRSQRRFSLLILGMEAQFIQKATSKTFFSCREAEKIQQAISRCIESGEGVVVEVSAIGKDSKGDVVSEFKFTWSFKVKT